MTPYPHSSYRPAAMPSAMAYAACAAHPRGGRLAAHMHIAAHCAWWMRLDKERGALSYIATCAGCTPRVESVLAQEGWLLATAPGVINYAHRRRMITEGQ